MDTLQLAKDLRAAIINELDNCEYADVPFVYNMVQDKDSKEILIKEIEKKVIKQRIFISNAIVQIDNEYNPNTLD
jgi:hypothetical protein